jgi:hypothetical protein
MRRHPNRPLRALLLLLGLATPAAVPVLAQQPARTNGGSRAPRNPVQNGLPLEPARTVEFTATEGSWMSVDVSPDGRTLVFDLLGDIYTMPIAGGRATPLSTGMAFDAQPRFSPDGKRIVFTSDRSGGEGVWILSLDLKDTLQVTRGKTAKYDSPTWTPDGNYIVVTRGMNLHLYHVKGGTGTQLTRPPSTPAAGAGPGGRPPTNLRYMGAAVSRDGRYVWAARRAGSTTRRCRTTSSSHTTVRPAKWRSARRGRGPRSGRRSHPMGSGSSTARVTGRRQACASVICRRARNGGWRIPSSVTTRSRGPPWTCIRAWHSRRIRAT